MPVNPAVRGMRLQVQPPSTVRRKPPGAWTQASAEPRTTVTSPIRAGLARMIQVRPPSAVVSILPRQSFMPQATNVAMPCCASQKAID
jgi:hypothetical protein